MPAANQSTSDFKGDHLSVKMFGAKGDGSHDDTPAFQSALSSGNPIMLAPGGVYKVTEPIIVTSGAALFCTGPSNDRWRADSYGAVVPKILCYGTGGFKIAPSTRPSSVDSIVLSGFTLDGQNIADGESVDGLVMDASASGAFIEGVLLDNLTIRNFPRHQIYADGTVFDITMRRVSANNQSREFTTGEDTIYFDQTGSLAYSQLKFDDCYLFQYVNGKWVVRIKVSTSTTFIGGTIAGYAGYGGGPGASGVFCAGNLDIFGTHFEGLPGKVAPVGIRYTGTIGARIFPSVVATFGTGIQIGDPDNPSTPATCAVISGGIGYNNVWEETFLIEGASNSAPIVIKLTGHPYDTDDIVRVDWPVYGNQAAIGTADRFYLWKITKTDDDHFSLNGSVADGDWTSGGTVKRAVAADIEIVAGGSREGTIIQSVAYSGGFPAIINRRLLTDAVSTDVTNLLSNHVSGIKSLGVTGDGSNNPIVSVRGYALTPDLIIEATGKVNMGCEPTGQNYRLNIEEAFGSVDVAARLGVGSPVVIGKDGSEMGRVYVLTAAGRYFKVDVTEADGAILTAAGMTMELIPDSYLLVHAGDVAKPTNVIIRNTAGQGSTTPPLEGQDSSTARVWRIGADGVFYPQNGAGLYSGDAVPTAAAIASSLYLCKGNGKLYVYNGSAWSVASFLGAITDTHANRLTTPAGETGTPFYESDTGLTYASDGSHWVYKSGVYQRTQSQLAAFSADLTAYDAGLVVLVTDYAHKLRWTGSAWTWEDPGDQSDRVDKRFSDPDPATGWHLMDGSTVSYLLKDGTTASRTLQDLTSDAAHSAYLRLGSPASSGVNAASAPIATLGAVGGASGLADDDTGLPSTTLAVIPASNLITYSEALSNASWLILNSAVKDSDIQISFAADADSMVYHGTAGVVAAGPYTFSVWARVASGSQIFRIRIYDAAGSYTITADLTATTTPQQFFVQHTAVGGGILYAYLINGSDAAARTVIFEQMQLSASLYPIPYAKTTTSVPPVNVGASDHTHNYLGASLSHTHSFTQPTITDGAHQNIVLRPWFRQ